MSENYPITKDAASFEKRYRGFKDDGFMEKTVLKFKRLFKTLASPLKTYPIGVTYPNAKGLWITYPKIYLSFLTFKQKLWGGGSFLFLAVI